MKSLNLHRLALIATLTLPLHVLAQGQGNAQTNRFNGDWLSASAYNNAGGLGYHSRSAWASDNRNVKGQVQGSYLNFYEYVSTSAGFGYRFIQCALPTNIVQASDKGGAQVSFTLDSGNSACTSHGYHYDYGTASYSGWPFSSESLQVNLANPLYTRQANSHQVSTYGPTNESWRQNCKTFRGEGASGTINLAGDAWSSPYNSYGTEACNVQAKF